MLKFGFASHEFTPSRPALIMGQMYVRVGREAKDPLTLTAWAIEADEGNGSILIAADLVGVPDALVALVRQRLADRLPDVHPERLVFSATHTHDSLVLRDGWYPHPGGEVMTAEACITWVADRAVEAAVEAWESRVPRASNRAFGHAVVGHNRRVVYADGSARMYGATTCPEFMAIEGYEDHSLDMLFVWEPDGRLVGVLLTIPCPSQVEEHLEVFSADYWHEIRVELRRRYGKGLSVLGLCGAAGDQSPHLQIYGREEQEMRRRRQVSERQEIADRVADAVSIALNCTEPISGDLPFAHVTQRVELPALCPTREQRDWAQAEEERAVHGGMDPALWWPRRQREVVTAFDGGKPLPAVPVELHALRLGDAVMVTNPFELFLDYAMRIKARSPAAQTAVVQLTGGTALYLPTEKALRGGHYSALPAVCLVGPEGGQQLVEASLAMIGKL